MKNITQDELKPGTFYAGEGRFIGDIALWTGKVFMGFQCKFGQYMETSADYGDKGFSPKKRVK